MGKTFWDQGIRFECQGTGKCCLSRGAYGYVYFTRMDRKRIAQVLSIPTSSFTRKYLKNTNGFFHLKNPQDDCIFLEGRGCRVYEGRPEQCRTWPFWPENMNSKTWKNEILPFCKGVGKGRLYTPEEIRDCMKRDPVAG